MTPPKIPRLSLRKKDGRLLLEPNDLGAVADAIGRTMFAAFLKCFVGLDRIVSLEQFLALNHEHLDHDSVAHERNLRNIVFLLGGAAYELGKALEHLHKAGIAGRLPDPSAWRDLDKLRRQWNGNQLLSRLRNDHAHHFGELTDYAAGVSALIADGSWSPLIVGDGQRRHEVQYSLAIDALFRGTNLQLEELEVMARETRAAHESLPGLVEELFLQVAEASGVQVERREEGSDDD